MDAKILVKRLKVGDKVTIREDLNQFEGWADDHTYFGVNKGIISHEGQEATITEVRDLKISEDSEIQEVFLDVGGDYYSWSIEMFETINEKENPYKELVTDFNFKGYVPMELFD